MDWKTYSTLDLPVVMNYDDRYEQTPWEELNDLCSKDDPAALYERAGRLRRGEGVEKSIYQAMQDYTRVLQLQKHTRAMYFMGAMCRYDMNSADCITFFRMGSGLGDPDCSYELGELYRYGDFVEESAEQAISFYELSAEQGDINSLVSAGEVCLDNGDYDRALTYFIPQYQNNDPVAAYYIGKMYYYGMGVEESDAKAFPYLKMASEGDVKEANVMLAALYGFGHGTEKDVPRALKLLDDVKEDDVAWSYNVKARIYLTEGNMEEGRMWLQKSAELGDEDAKMLLEQGAGKTDEELAEEGADPYAMIRYYRKLMGFTEEQKTDFTKAKEIMIRANRLFPDNMDVKELYFNMMLMSGHIATKIGAKQDAYETLKQCVNEFMEIKGKNLQTEYMKSMEPDLFMEYGEAAYYVDDHDTALDMFSRTDREKNPYAVVLSAVMHMSDERRYASEIANEARFLAGAIGSDKWRDEIELASAYLVLSWIYSRGVQSTVAPDVNYAYTCIQKCAEINPEMASEELKKYSRNLFGKITYRER